MFAQLGRRVLLAVAHGATHVPPPALLHARHGDPGFRGRAQQDRARSGPVLLRPDQLLTIQDQHGLRAAVDGDELPDDAGLVHLADLERARLQRVRQERPACALSAAGATRPRIALPDQREQCEVPQDLPVTDLQWDHVCLLARVVVLSLPNRIRSGCDSLGSGQVIRRGGARRRSGRRSRRPW